MLAVQVLQVLDLGFKYINVLITIPTKSKKL